MAEMLNVTYGRSGMDTHAALEQVFCQLESATQALLAPSGMAAICTRKRSGEATASWTFHSGQAPPKRAKRKRVALWRLVILPA